MTFSLKKDFKTIEELRDSPDAILRQIKKNEHSVVVTRKGKPAAVLLTVDQYEWMVHLINFAGLIAEGEEDIRAGRTRPAEEFFKELLGKNRRAKKVSGRSRLGRPA
jgi:prevent-host-death family protein